MSKQKDIVTTKDINKAAFRYMFMACNTFNYETQQGPAVVFGLNKLLRKIYPDDNEYLASLNNHFNLTARNSPTSLRWWDVRAWIWHRTQCVIIAPKNRG